MKQFHEFNAPDYLRLLSSSTLKQESKNENYGDGAFAFTNQLCWPTGRTDSGRSTPRETISSGVSDGERQHLKEKLKAAVSEIADQEQRDEREAVVQSSTSVAEIETY